MGVARAPPEFGGSEKRVEKSEIDESIRTSTPGFEKLFTALCKHLAIFNVKLRDRPLELKAILFFLSFLQRSSMFTMTGECQDVSSQQRS